MSKKSAILIPVIAILALKTAPAAALETAWSKTDHLEGRIITGVESVEAEAESFDATLELKMGEGWHTYWRNPGDAGLPPRFDWAKSQNIEFGEILWPAPVRKLELDFHTFGYSDAVAFPITVHLAEPGKPARIELRSDVMVCKDICIPQTLNFALDIPVGNGQKSPQHELVEAAKLKVPVLDAEGADLRIESIVSGPNALAVAAYSEDGFENTDVFVTLDKEAFTAPPEVTVDANDPKRAMIKIPAIKGVEDLSAYVAGRSLAVTLVNKDAATEKTIGF